jgi:hypothetical protein
MFACGESVELIVEPAVLLVQGGLAHKQTNNEYWVG